MFREDQPKVARFALASAENLGQVLALALLSAKVPFRRMDGVMRELRAGNRQGIQNISSIKIRGLDWIEDNKEGLYRYLVMLYQNSPDVRWFGPDLMIILLACPGLGMVKSGFILQMLGFEGGCLDSRNLNRLGLKKTQVRYRAERRGSKAESTNIFRYLNLCADLGGAEKLWNDWCKDLAEENPDDWPGGEEEVSRWHWKILAGD